jgi:Fe-S-cluster containining protein
MDELSVLQIEADLIRSKHNHLLDNGIPHVRGACAFLDDHGGCRIYAQRPYVCRTQGLPLRWYEEDEFEWVEYRDICPLNEDEKEPIETLSPEACWEIGPAEQRLAQLQEEHYGQQERVRLRDLFKRQT